MDQKKLARFIPLAAFLFIMMVLFTNSTFITINSGETGVLFKKFGGGLEKEQVYGQGFHVVAPWNDLFVYDIRTQESFADMEVLSKNGLTIKCELSYRYFPIADKVGYLHDEIGKNYHDRIIIPEIRSATREVIGKYLPEELYSSKREVIQDEIFSRTKEALERNYLVMDAVLIREVSLPASLQEAIETKLKQEQESLEYEFKLQKATKEAERLKIEAQGKSDAYNIISQSLTDKILKEKGIEATLSLAESENSKIIVIGSGESGMPLILGGD